MKEAFKTIHGNCFATPQWLFDACDREFGFTWDLAASRVNAKCFDFFDEQDDSLSQDWHRLKGWLWLNPPYSPLKPWIVKAQKEYLKGARIVVLCPAIVSTRYFSEVPPAEIRFILGRVPFLLNGKEMKSNTHDSMLLVYGPARASKISYVERESFRGFDDD